MKSVCILLTTTVTKVALKDASSANNTTVLKIDES